MRKRMSSRMKGFACCGDCIYYNYKKHKCNLGASVETDARNPFYDDCPIPDIPSEQAIRDKAIDELCCKLTTYFADCQLIEERQVIRDILGEVTERIDKIAEQMKEVRK